MSDHAFSALEYHKRSPTGKLKIVPTKPCDTKESLAYAYSPGVAEPCKEIHSRPASVYDSTMKGNTVAVVTNGTAVLGLGNIGTLASIPVMEGKCVLLKRCADIDGIPLTINTPSKQSFVSCVRALEDSFGAINLEDISAPDCFWIESQLQKKLTVPVFHDDQHGTAIVILAALKRSLQQVRKKMDAVRIVILGAGAAGLATGELLYQAGVPKQHIVFVDRSGVITKSRIQYLSKEKKKWAHHSGIDTLSDALSAADVCIGLSTGNILHESHIRSMNTDPIVFALANPTPEVSPIDALRWGAALIATGRSDFPNQVNNALGFPGIFRALLDTRARMVTTRMKLAAADALYRCSQLYDMIPDIFDPDVVPSVASAVAQTAMEEGVSRMEISDIHEYAQHLRKRISLLLA